MRKAILSFLAVFLFGTIYCIAETQLAVADIPFSFIAEGKTYPAGSYQFKANDDESAVTINSVKPGKSGIVPILTRLAPIGQNQVEVVFDVVGNDHLLSELHTTNADGFMMDGFLFKAATAKHTHVRVKAKK